MERTLISLISFNILILVFLFDVGFLKRRNRREEKRTEQRNRREEKQRNRRAEKQRLKYGSISSPSSSSDSLLENMISSTSKQNPYKKRRSKLKLKTHIRKGARN
jgi:hypothetical protein